MSSSVSDVSGVPAWSGRWVPGEVAGSSFIRADMVPRGVLPSEKFVFDPAEMLSPSGFSEGAMLAGLLDCWSEARPEVTAGLPSDLRELYLSPEELLFAACARFSVSGSGKPKLLYRSGTLNPAMADLAAPEHCGSPRCNGDFECDDCADLEFSDVGPPVLVTAEKLYMLCDELFPTCPPGRLLLANSLTFAADPGSVMRAELLRSEDLPSFLDVTSAMQMSPRSLAVAFADSLAVDLELSDEECAALSKLVRTLFPLTISVRQFVEQVVTLARTVKAVFV